MAIVTIGNLPLQIPEQGSPEFVLTLVKQIEGDISEVVGRFVDESLETEVERFLGRGRYRRRKKAKRQEQGAYCSKCRSHQRQDFRRNGHYGRNLVTHWGQISVNLPQVKCRCGGNVKMKYQTIRSRQRIWDDVKVEVLAEYGRGLSYWIREQGTEGDISDIKEGLGQTQTGVKIALPMSHNFLTKTTEQVK